MKRILLTLFLSAFFLLPLQGKQTPPIACVCSQLEYHQPNYEYYDYDPFIEPGQVPAAPVQPVQQIPAPQQVSQKVVRGAIDIGSGATKLRVAEVNLKDRKIDRIIINESFPVQYQEHLSKSPDNTFDEQVMQTGIDAISKSKEIAMQNGAEKVIAVATASFRKAANSQEFIDRIYKETGVRVYVIDQELEGKLAFNAVLSQGNYNPNSLIVWDIGGGSLQMTALNPHGGYDIFRGDLASIQFKNMMIKEIQHKNVNQVTTPNPLTPKDIQQGLAKSREVTQEVDQIFKKRINQPQTQIVGVGNIFAYGIYPLVGKKSSYTLQDLGQATVQLAGKDDQQLGGGDYANVQATNAILVLGYMQGLNIQNMQVLDVNNADGALLYPDFWNA